MLLLSRNCDLDNLVNKCFSICFFNLVDLCVRVSMALFFTILLFSFHLETHPRPTTVEPRRPGPKPHPASPDWAAAATRRPDLNPRVVTFNLRAFELIDSCCICWGWQRFCVHAGLWHAGSQCARRWKVSQERTTLMIKSLSWGGEMDALVSFCSLPGWVEGKRFPRG